ncbi:MAG: tripartite tricarboxylate transporter substrate binding protein [Burkholderiales bacterium]
MTRKIRTRTSLGCWLVVFTVTTLVAGNASAQEAYPARPVHVVVGATAGALDTMTRQLFGAVAKELAQSVVVENKPGAGQAVGYALVTKSKPDGYTLGVTTTSLMTNVPHMQKTNFDVLNDSVDIMAFCRYAQVLAVGAQTPWKTFEELLVWAKANPGKFRYAVSGPGVAMHIAMEQIAMQEGIQWIAIPFRGGGSDAVAAALGGHTEGVAQSPVETGEHIKAGKLRPLLVLTDSRVADFPEVPTILEKGYKFTATTYMSVYAPKGLPEPIRDKLEGALKRAMSDPAYVAAARTFQLEPVFMSGRDYSNYWRPKFDEMGKVVRALGLEAK